MGNCGSRSRRVRPQPALSAASTSSNSAVEEDPVRGRLFSQPSSTGGDENHPIPEITSPTRLAATLSATKSVEERRRSWGRAAAAGQMMMAAAAEHDTSPGKHRRRSSDLRRHSVSMGSEKRSPGSPSSGGGSRKASLARNTSYSSPSNQSVNLQRDESKRSSPEPQVRLQTPSDEGTDLFPASADDDDGMFFLMAKKSKRRDSVSSVALSTASFSPTERDSPGLDGRRRGSISNDRTSSRRLRAKVAGRRSSLVGSLVIGQEYLDFHASHALRIPTTVTTHVSTGKDDFGYKFVNQYNLVSTLGRGSYGKVKLAVNIENDTPYAIKICTKSKLKRKRFAGATNALADVRREILLLKRLEHPRVVKLFEVIDSSFHDRLYMIMELCDRSVFTSKNMTPLPVPTIRAHMRDLVLGIEYLHSQGIIHRDIKPENLLVTPSGVLKVSDFGVSEIVPTQDTLIKKTAGTPAFLAPECCSGEPFLGPPVDVWAMGVTLYAFTFGRVPFRAQALMDMYEKIKSAEITFPFDVDHWLADLLMGMLERDPAKRLTLPEIREHPFVTENGMYPMPDQDMSTNEWPGLENDQDADVYRSPEVKDAFGYHHDRGDDALRQEYLNAPGGAGERSASSLSHFSESSFEETSMIEGRGSTVVFRAMDDDVEHEHLMLDSDSGAHASLTNTPSGSAHETLSSMFPSIEKLPVLNTTEVD